MVNWSPWKKTKWDVTEKKAEEIMGNNFPNLGKWINTNKSICESWCLG